jgi:hypothetical protein
MFELGFSMGTHRARRFVHIAKERRHTNGLNECIRLNELFRAEKGIFREGWPKRPK